MHSRFSSGAASCRNLLTKFSSHLHRKLHIRTLVPPSMYRGEPSGTEEQRRTYYTYKQVYWIFASPPFISGLTSTRVDGTVVGKISCKEDDGHKPDR